MRFGFLLFIFILAFRPVSGFTLHGVVYTSNNEKLPYTNIYVKGTTNGTSANAEGQYHFDLPAGTYEIVFQHLGYQQHIEHVVLEKDVELNVTLKEIEYQIKDVEINGNEDPAWAVIRKAIER